MSGARRLLAQAASMTGVNMWLAALGLVTTPFLLTRLGPATYGVFAMIALVSSHLQSIEFGFGHATIRFAARATGASDSPEVRRILETSFTVFLVAGALAACVLLFGASWLVHSFFRIPSEIRAEALTSFRLASAILFVTFIATFLSAGLQAVGRVGWFAGWRGVFGTAASVAAVGVVALGGHLASVVFAQLLIAALSSLILAAALFRVNGECLRLRLHFPTFKAMGSFGAIVFISGLAYQAMINGPALVLAALVSSADVPAFAVPSTVAQKLLLLVGSVSVAFLPFASAAEGPGDRVRLATIFRSHLRLSLLGLGFVAAYLAVFAQTLLSSWVTPVFAREATPSLQLLMLATLAFALGSPCADVARAVGRPSWVLAYTLVAASLGITGALLWIPQWKSTGAALGFLVGAGLTTAPFVGLVATRLLSIPIGDLARDLVGPAGALALAVGTFLVAQWLSPRLIMALGAGATVAIGYAAGVAFFVLTPRERATLLGWTGRV